MTISNPTLSRRHLLAAAPATAGAGVESGA